jgi:fumarate reductase flavoprotein subunit
MGRHKGLMQRDVDVLVIGADACGLAAAVAAHDAGVSVAIVEKMDRPPGNSSLSTDSVPAATTRFQRQAGIVDATKQFVADLMRTLKELLFDFARLQSSVCNFAHALKRPAPS